jgi:hypothetical protein
VEDQWNQSFRDKIAFIILYDMSSKIQTARLEQWVAKVFECSNNKYSIVMVLGNNA